MIFSFHWQASAPSGVQKSGVLREFSEKRARAILRGQGLHTIVISRGEFILVGLWRRRRVKRTNIIAFVRALKTMTAAGMLISDALAILAEQEDDRRLARVLFSLKVDLLGGASFSQAIISYPHIFDPFFVSLVSVGESIGKLPEALERVAIQMEKGERLSRQIKSAMSYPLMVLTITIALIFVMLLYVIPSFEKMFGTMPLPLPTQILLRMSTFAKNYWLPSFLVFVFSLITLSVGAKTTQGRRIVDALALRVPLWGVLIKKGTAVRVARSMSLLTASGVLAVDALGIAANAIENSVLKERLQMAMIDMMGGKSISEPLRQTGIFSPLALGLVAVGETSKSLADVLAVVADFYDEEIASLSASISRLIEPIMTIFIGLIVGAMLLAMYLPIFGVIAVSAR